MVMTLTNRAKPATPTKWRASYPSTRDRASQSLAEPSAKVNASTIAPMASVRGSTHADPPRFCELRPPVRTAGRKALVAASSAARARMATTTRWIPSGTPNRVASTPSPAPVIEPRLHAAWNRGSTVRPSRVSTCAPSTFMATSQVAVPKPKRHSPAAVTAVSRRPPTPRATRPMPRATSTAPDRTMFAAPNRSIIRPLSGVPSTDPTDTASSSSPSWPLDSSSRSRKVGNPRPQGGEVEPVEDEDRSNGVASLRDRIAGCRGEQ